MAKSDSFKSQHQDLLQVVGQMTPLLDTGKLGKDANEVRNLLSRLAGKITVHLSMEDKVLYPAMLSHSDAKVKATAQKFINEMGGIATAFTQYNDKWKTASTIQTNPDGFIRETKGIVDALGARITKENNELYTLYDSI